jgi:autotransporter-associated beta strand protein
MSRLRIVGSRIVLVIACTAAYSMNASAQILMCDRISNNILEYNTDGSFRRNLIGTGSTLPDGPSGMAFGNGYDLFVSSINDGNVLKYDWKTGTPAAAPFATGLYGPSGVLFDKATNSLYVSEFGNFDGHTVVRFDATSGVETGRFAAAAGGGYSDMALGTDGMLYVGNFYYGQVLKFDPANTAAPPVVFAGNAALQGSNGLLFNASGKLDVVGLMSQNVVRFNADGTFAGELVSAASQMLYFPSDVALDPDGILLVACMGNNSNSQIPYAPGYIGKFDAATGAPVNPYFIIETQLASWIQPTALLIEPFAVWTGSMPTNNWTSAGNWGGAAPVDPAAVRFGNTVAGGNAAPQNDFSAGTQFNGITFSGGNTTYALTGNAIKLGGPVVNQSEHDQTIGLDLEMVLGGGTFDTGAHNITVSGDIGGSFPLTKKGTGDLVLQGDSNYTGATTVLAGKMIVTGSLSHSPSVLVQGAAQLSAAGIVTDALTIGGASNAQAVPEPSAIALLLLGGFSIAFSLRRRI